MKKISIFLALAMIIMASCSKDDDIKPVVPISFNLSDTIVTPIPSGYIIARHVIHVTIRGGAIDGSDEIIDLVPGEITTFSEDVAERWIGKDMAAWPILDVCYQVPSKHHLCTWNMSNPLYTKVSKENVYRFKMFVEGNGEE